MCRVLRLRAAGAPGMHGAAVRAQPRAPDTARLPVQAASRNLPTSVGLGCAVRLPAATVIFLVLAARARSCLALAGCTLRRGRAARLRRPAGLRIAWHSTRACLRSRAPDARGRAARGRRCGVATLAELLIHHGPRVLGLRRPIHRGDAGTVAHRGALRL